MIMLLDLQINNYLMRSSQMLHQFRNIVSDSCSKTVIINFLKSIHYFNLMDTNIKVSGTFLVCLTILFLCTGCPWKECTSPDRAYGAEHTIFHKNKIKVGDTIWIESMIDCNKMLNLITNTEDVFCGQDFSFNLGISKLIDSIRPTTIGSLNDFNFIKESGNIYWDSTIPGKDYFMQVEFEKKSNSYQLKIGLAPKEKGRYLVTTSPGGSFGKDHCDRSSLDNIIVNEDRGHEIYIEYRSPQELTERDLRNIFCFEVQ